MASVPPFGVEVEPSGFGQNKEWLDFLVSVLNLIATISIPFLLWWYSKQQGKQQEQQAAQQRLQAHVALLSDAGGNAMIVIGTLKQDCDAINRVYTDVFREMREVQGAGVTITRQQLQQVNTARKRLQGIWDNIMDDYRANLLGGSITDPRHGRMLLRGLAYMKLVEPLEAANFARMQASDRTVAPQEGSESTETHVLPATVTNVTAGQDISTSQSLTEAAIKCRIGARASRYRWLENQRTIQLIKKPLWPSKAEQQPIPTPSLLCCPRKRPSLHQKVTECCIFPAAAKELEGGSAEQQAWTKDLKKHWAALQQACTPLTPPAAAAGQEPQPEACKTATPPAATAAAAAGQPLRQVQVLVDHL